MHMEINYIRSDEYIYTIANDLYIIICKYNIIQHVVVYYLCMYYNNDI